jgi:antitoxin component of MazEF toxin-antitoxin module
MPKAKITKVGGHSSSVVIPIQIMKDLHWHKKQKVEVKRVPRGVKITDARSKKRKRV